MNGGTVGPGNPGNPNAVPEPGTLALLAIGLLGFAVVRRRRNAIDNASFQAMEKAACFDKLE